MNIKSFFKRLSIPRIHIKNQPKLKNATIKPQFLNIDDQLALDFIRWSSQGSIMQAGICGLIILLSDIPDGLGFIVVLGLIAVSVSQLIRFFYYRAHAADEAFLLKKLSTFLNLSYLTGAGWGIAGFFAVHAVGTVGIGLTLIFAVVGVMAAVTYAPLLVPQRIYLFTVFAPTFLGLLTFSLPQVQWAPVLMFLLYAIYCVAVSTRQNHSLVLVYEQQVRIFKDIQAARDIQRSLLPEPRQVSGDFEIDVLYRPCEDLSGDFFEIQKLPQHMLFYVADVTSHGTASAQVTYLLKGIFKSVIDELGTDINVAQIAKKIAKDYSSYGLNYSISLFLGSLNTENGVLDYISSNFPEPILIDTNSSQILPTIQNPLIDAMLSGDEVEFQKNSVQLVKGGSLFVFTDGTFEFRDPKTGREFGLNRFRRTLVANWKNNWSESVYETLKASNAGNMMDDDITILRLSRF